MNNINNSTGVRGPINCYECNISQSFVSIWTEDVPFFSFMRSEHFLNALGLGEFLYGQNAGAHALTFYTNGSDSPENVSYEPVLDLTGASFTLGTDLTLKDSENAVDNSVLVLNGDHTISGDITLSTDSNGDVVERTRYYPFGKILAGGDSRNLFTGQEYDTDTSLYYYGARYYNPTIRRFTQPDMIIQDPYNPQNLNRYSYTVNNPLKYIDPTGHVYWKGLGASSKNLARAGTSAGSVYVLSAMGLVGAPATGGLSLALNVVAVAEVEEALVGGGAAIATGIASLACAEGDTETQKSIDFATTVLEQGGSSILAASVAAVLTEGDTTETIETTKAANRVTEAFKTLGVSELPPGAAGVPSPFDLPDEGLGELYKKIWEQTKNVIQGNDAQGVVDPNEED